MTERTEEQFRNAEAKFASPEDNTGIGYYWDGEEVSPEEFSRKVGEKADRLRAERTEARGGVARPVKQKIRPSTKHLWKVLF